MQQEKYMLLKLKLNYVNAITSNKFEDDKIYLYVEKALKELSDYYNEILQRVDVNWKEKINWVRWGDE